MTNETDILASSQRLLVSQESGRKAVRLWLVG